MQTRIANKPTSTTYRGPISPGLLPRTQIAPRERNQTEMLSDSTIFYRVPTFQHGERYALVGHQGVKVKFKVRSGCVELSLRVGNGLAIKGSAYRCHLYPQSCSSGPLLSRLHTPSASTPHYPRTNPPSPSTTRAVATGLPATPRSDDHRYHHEQRHSDRCSERRNQGRS